MRPRVAVVLFNLGGPDRPEAIRPFLINLFSDPAILRVPFFVRPFLARRIAAARLAPARANYALLGGRSPLLELTRAQAAALEAEMSELDVKCFIAMRYWHPFSDETARAVRDWRPDEVVLLPLYPQYSTTTTGSSLTAWREAAARAGLVASTSVLCCYPTECRLCRCHQRPGCRRHGSRHGRSWIFNRVAGAVLRPRPAGSDRAGRRSLPVADRADRCGCSGRVEGSRLIGSICYQSRATPQKWLEPSTEHEIERAAHDQVAVLVVPIAFVSEHSETLVELDVEYRRLAERLGVPGYFRVPTQGADTAFIAALAKLVRSARAHGPGLCSHVRGRFCPADRKLCPVQ